VAATSHKIEFAELESINSHHAFEQAIVVAGAASTNVEIVARHAEVVLEVAKNGAELASKGVELAVQRVGDDGAKIALLEIELDGTYGILGAISGCCEVPVQPHSLIFWIHRTILDTLHRTLSHRFIHSL